MSDRSRDPSPVDATCDAWGLSARELEVVALVCDGRSNREIADALVISARTVQTHVARLLRKTESRTRTEMAVRAVRLGVVPMSPCRCGKADTQ